jgi:hypothetical protein
MKGRGRARRTPQQVDVPGCIPSLAGAPLADRHGTAMATVVDLVHVSGPPSPHGARWLLVRLPDAVVPFTYVPADRMRHRAADVVVPFDVERIRSAPVRVAEPRTPSPEHVARLDRHYGARLPAPVLAAA